MATKSERELRKGLKDATTSVAYFLAAMDFAMKQPESEARGKMIAKFCNGLDVANDSVMRFSLGMGSPAIKKLKKESASIVELARGKANGRK